MSKRERHYLEVLQRLSRHELTRSAASLELSLSERQVYRLLSRYRNEGDAGIVHRHRGRSSNRGHTAETRARVLAMYKEREYRDYGPQLFSEVLEQRLKVRIGAETLRQWLMTAGLWSGRRAPRRHRKKRDRREGIGSLVQFDGSEHDWFEGRGPACCLLVAIDDASSRVFMRFAPSEDTKHAMRTLWQYVERYGIPRALYTDHGTVYTPTQGDPRTGSRTEFGRAMQQLGVEMIFANSPQAKGRVERSNRTQQDRLIKALRREGVSTIEAANRYLDEHYMAEHNQRFACLEGKPDVHRSIFGLHLENIFCFEDQRQVRNDYTVLLGGAFLQLERVGTSLLPPPKTIVTARQWLDGSLHLTWNETELAFRTLEGRPEANPQSTPAPSRQHPWRKRPVSEHGKQTQQNFSRSG